MKHGPMISLMMTLLLAGSPRASAAPPQPDAKADAPKTVRVEVDPEGLRGPQPDYVTDQTAFYIRDDSTKMLVSTQHLTVVPNGDAPEIRVTLSWASYKDSKYEVAIHTTRPGDEPKLLERFECECTDTELSNAVLERVPAALQQLAEEPPGPQTPNPPDESNPSETTQPPPDDTTPKPRALGPVGGLGILATIGGVALASVGVVQFTKGESTEPDADEQQTERANYRPAGGAWLGAGIATTVVGVTMLAVDLTVLKKRRQRAVSWTPTVSPRHVGLSVAGRF